MKRRLTAWILTLCMAISLLPGTVFAQDGDAEASYNQFQVSYDMNGGSVYWSRGANLPVGDGEDFLGDGEWTTNVNQNSTVHFLLDPENAVDRDAWFNDGELLTYPSFEAEDRSVNVRVEYPTVEGWFSAIAVVNGQAAAEGFSYADRVLSFQTADAEGQVFVRIWWTDHDFEYYSFEPGEGELLIDYQWNGEGEVYLDPEVTVLRSCPQPEQGRTRITVPDSTERVSFTWTGHVRKLWVEGEGDENGWGELSGQGLSTYTYELDRVNENNDPWNHYGINFEFYWDWSCQIRVNYDVWGGSVFQTLGDSLPAAEAADYLYDGDITSFAQDGELQTVRLLFDQARGVDRDAYEADGTLRFVDSNVEAADRELYVFAGWTDAGDTTRWDWVVEAGEAVMEGFSFENNILSFTPETGCEINLDVFWCRADYDFRNFDWDENSVMIEFNFWGDGSVRWPEGVDLGSMVQPERCRGKVLVPLGTESLRFTWDGHLRTLGVFGLEGEWEQTEWSEPGFDSYTLILNQTEADGSPKRTYRMNFDFADANDWNYRFAASYDDNGGAVFCGVGETPAATASCYLPRQGNGNESWPDHISFDNNGAPAEIKLLFDPTIALDFDAWDNGELSFRESWQSDDRAITVAAKYTGLDGIWHEDVLVLCGEANGAGVSFADNLLTWTPESGYGVDFDIYWTRTDYEFSRFQPTEEKPVMVEIQWWGDGEALLDEAIPDEDVMAGDGRMRVRVPWDKDSLTLTWDGEADLRQINVNGLGENGEWLNGIVPEGNTYVLELNQTDEWGNPRDWYHIQFEFEGPSMPQNGRIRVYYDQNGGSVFRALDYENYPEATAEYYQFEGDAGEFSYLDENGESRDVRLLIDETQALDWSLWDEAGEIGFVEPNYYDLRNLIVYVRSNRLEGVVVWDGNTTEYGEYKGFHFSSENVLSFGRVDGTSDLEIKIYWTEADYWFDQFHGTEEAPVCVQVDWWGSGQINLPEGIDPENLLVENHRARIRVPLDTESLSFTWEENAPLRQINVNGYQGYEDWYNDVPFEGNSYTLKLNAAWENGEPRDWYHIQFEFEESNFQAEGMLISFYDQSKGSIFWALGEEEPVCDPAHYLGFGFEYPISYMPDGSIRPVSLYFDETRAALFDENGNPSGFEETMELEDRAITVWAESIGYDGKILDNGVLTAFGQEHGYSFEDNILRFTPENGVYVLFHVDWCISDALFDDFRPTDEFPVIVEYNYYNYGEIIPPEGIAPENILIQPGRARMRVSADTESLTFTWAENYGVHRVSWTDVNYEEEWHEIYVDQSEPHSFNLYLDNGDDNGINHCYILDFEFFPDSRYQLWVNWCGSEGNVYYGLNEVPALDIANYIFENPSYLVTDEAGNASIGTVYLRLDHEHSVTYFDETHTELYELGDWEGYDPSVYVEYVHDDGSWFEGFAVRHGQAVAEGFRFEDDVLSFTPENEQPVAVWVFWSDDDLNYQSFEGSEDKPVMVELMLGGRAPVELPVLPTEDVLIWHAAEHDYVKLRVSADCESLIFRWTSEGVISLIEVDGAGPDGRTLMLYAPPGSSYTLMLDQMDWEGPSTYYHLTFWADYRPENPFADVPDTAWYREAVLFAVACGLTAGTSENTFSPNQIVTRSQLVTFLWRAADSPTPGGESGFRDVPESAWYYSAVLWAAENGITAGTGNGAFSPNKACTRAEAVTLLWRAAGSPAPEQTVCGFADVPEDAWYRDAVVWAVERGITVGTGETSFSPGLQCTRAQAVVFLYRFLMESD